MPVVALVTGPSETMSPSSSTLPVASGRPIPPPWTRSLSDGWLSLACPTCSGSLFGDALWLQELKRYIDAMEFYVSRIETDAQQFSLRSSHVESRRSSVLSNQPLSSRAGMLLSPRGVQPPAAHPTPLSTALHAAAVTVMISPNSRAARRKTLQHPAPMASTPRAADSGLNTERQPTVSIADDDVKVATEGGMEHIGRLTCSVAIADTADDGTGSEDDEPVPVDMARRKASVFAVSTSPSSSYNGGSGFGWGSAVPLHSSATLDKGGWAAQSTSPLSVGRRTSIQSVGLQVVTARATALPTTVVPLMQESTATTNFSNSKRSDASDTDGNASRSPVTHRGGSVGDEVMSTSSPTWAVETQRDAAAALPFPSDAVGGDATTDILALSERNKLPSAVVMENDMTDASAVAPASYAAAGNHVMSVQQLFHFPSRSPALSPIPPSALGGNALTHAERDRSQDDRDVQSSTIDAALAQVGGVLPAPAVCGAALSATAATASSQPWMVLAAKEVQDKGCQTVLTITASSGTQSVPPFEPPRNSPSPHYRRAPPPVIASSLSTNCSTVHAAELSFETKRLSRISSARSKELS